MNLSIAYTTKEIAELAIALTPLDLSDVKAAAPTSALAKRLHVHTNEYRDDLQSMMQDYFDEGYTDDPDELDNRQNDLRSSFIAKMVSALTGAFGIGLAGADIRALGARTLQSLAEDNVTYFDGLLNDLTDAVDASDENTYDSLSDGFNARIGTYAGAAWNAGWQGVGDNLKQGATRRVQRELDDLAAHCDTCPPKAGIYDSFQAMQETVGVPGDGSDDCFSNCRCRLLVETASGSGVFESLIGLPTVFTAAIIDASNL